MVVKIEIARPGVGPEIITLPDAEGHTGQEILSADWTKCLAVVTTAIQEIGYCRFRQGDLTHDSLARPNQPQEFDIGDAHITVKVFRILLLPPPLTKTT